jgi:tRNA (guanine-N7-)-methyltransferase
LNKIHFVFYGRRKGRGLSPILAEQARMRLQGLSVDRWMDRWPEQVWLEIGFGFGEHLVDWVASRPDHYIIGAEVFENGIVSCVNRLPTQHDHRVALFDQPVAALFEKIPKNGLQGIMIRFPDPWPKRRHAGRRLIQDAFLDQCARVVCEGGELHFASDHEKLVDFSYSIFDHHKRWHCTMKSITRPPGWAVSRYEEKALARGDVCHYAVFQNMK